MNSSTQSPPPTDNAVDWWSVGAIGLFYLLIAGVGIAAAWYQKRRARTPQHQDVSTTEELVVGGRDMHLIVSIATMIATWVGGGYINGTAEAVREKGLLWAQAPIGYAISLLVGGLFFAAPMRRARYVTMIDIFQAKYGLVVGTLAYLPALCGELLWSSAILRALGSTIHLILNFDETLSVIISGAFAIFYTFVGGLYSVAYTDLVQLVFIAIGLSMSIPFAWHNDDMGDVDAYIRNNATQWLGTIPETQIGSYVDSYLLLICGGIPWQVYFQRVLSASTVARARLLSMVASIGCLLLAIPPILIGIIAQVADADDAWANVGQNTLPDAPDTLPYVIKLFTPYVVGVIGLAAVSAAVMSSSDSSILSASSMLAHNIIKGCIWRSASDFAVVWLLRLSIVLIGAISCYIAIVADSVYGLWSLSSDLVYVILFPQLCCALFIPFVNLYGIAFGYAIALILRFLVGIPEIGIPALVSINANIPVKSIIVLINFTVALIVSLLFIMIRRRFIFLPWIDNANIRNNDNSLPKRTDRIFTTSDSFELSQPVNDPNYKYATDF